MSPTQTGIPSTAGVSPTATAGLPPVEVTADPTSTATTPAGPSILHLTRGAELEIHVVDMQSVAEGWALGAPQGADDHVLVTSDGGRTWLDVTPPEPAVSMPYGTRRAAGSFQGTESAWVVYDHVHPEAGSYPVVVWRTEDRGRTWEASPALDLQGLEPDFIPRLMGTPDGDSGWLLVNVGAGMSHEYVVLYTTGDGGRSWERVLDPYGDAPIQVCWKTGLTFADARTGWMTRDCGGVVDGALVDVTNDGGRTWTSIPLPPPADQPEAFAYPNACGTHSPMLFSAQSGLLGVECATYDPDASRPGVSLVFRTEDGGAHWLSSPAPVGDLGLMDERLAWTFSREIHASDDDGETWSQVKVVNWDGQFDFVDRANGWAVARDGDEIALVRTKDGGSTWELLEPVTVSAP